MYIHTYVLYVYIQGCGQEMNKKWYSTTGPATGENDYYPPPAPPGLKETSETYQ